MSEAIEGKFNNPYNFGRALEAKLSDNDYQENNCFLRPWAMSV